MRRRSRFPALLIAIALTTFATGASASEEPPRAYDVGPHEPLDLRLSTLDELDDLIEAAMAAGHVPGLAAAIVTADGPIWYGAYGHAYLAPPEPVTIQTLFMLASVSKVVTGTAVMQAYEQGLFGLDDDIDSHLPFAVNHPVHGAVPLTARMLLSHVSSIDDNWSVMPYYEGDSPYPLGSYLEDYLTPNGPLYDPLLNFVGAPPGSQWHYSNIGIATVAFVVEAASGLPFDDFSDQHIFVPLDMTETAWHLADLDPSRIAMPYFWNGSEYLAYGHYGYSDYPSGQLRTSADQLARFIQCYLRGGELAGTRILDESTVDLMLSPHYPALNGGQGLAWQRDGLGWQHGGGDLGVSTLVSFDRVPGYGVVVLANAANGAVTNYVADRLYDQTLTLIWTDGFETGDTSMWSFVMP